MNGSKRSLESSSSSSTKATKRIRPLPAAAASPPPPVHYFKLDPAQREIHPYLVSFPFEAALVSCRRRTFPSRREGYALYLSQERRIYKATLWSDDPPTVGTIYRIGGAKPRFYDGDSFSIDIYTSPKTWEPVGPLAGSASYDPEVFFVDPLDTSPVGTYAKALRGTIVATKPDQPLRRGLSKRMLELYDGKQVMKLWCYNSSEDDPCWPSDLTPGTAALFFDALIESGSSAKVVGGFCPLSPAVASLEGVDDHRLPLGINSLGQPFSTPGSIDALPRLVEIREVYSGFEAVLGACSLIDLQGPYLFWCKQCKDHIYLSDAPSHPCDGAAAALEKAKGPYAHATLGNGRTYTDRVKCRDDFAQQMGWDGGIAEMLIDRDASLKALAHYTHATVRVFPYPSNKPDKVNFSLLSMQD